PHLNNPACVGGFRTSEARRRTKKQHSTQKTASSSAFRLALLPLFFTQNTSHRRGIPFIHI
ncbi:hypothetical protein EG477_RS27720, partial [Escherichia coli]